MKSQVKRILTAGARAIFMCMCCAFPVSAEQHEENGFTFSAAPDGWAVSVSELSLKEVDVPDSFDGMPVETLNLVPSTENEQPEWEVLRIPSGITAINLADENGASGYFPHLFRFEVAEENPNYQSIDGVLFDKSGRTLLRYPQAKADVVYSVPSGTETLGMMSFRGVQHLQELNLPLTLQTIADYALLGCQLPTVTLPQSVARIGMGAFGWNESLKKLTVPENTRVGGMCFAGCKALEAVTFLRTDELFFGQSIPGENDDYYGAAFDEFAGSAALYVPDGRLEDYRAGFQQAISAGNVQLFPLSEKPQEASSGIAGDANNDGRLSPADAYTLSDWLAGGKPDFAPAQADMDGNGRLNAADLSLLKRLLMTQTENPPAKDEYQLVIDYSANEGFVTSVAVTCAQKTTINEDPDNKLIMIGIEKLDPESGSDGTVQITVNLGYHESPFEGCTQTLILRLYQWVDSPAGGRVFFDSATVRIDEEWNYTIE